MVTCIHRFIVLIIFLKEFIKMAEWVSFCHRIIISQLIKFAGDTTLIGLFSNNKSIYGRDGARLTTWTLTHRKHMRWSFALYTGNKWLGCQRSIVIQNALPIAGPETERQHHFYYKESLVATFLPAATKEAQTATTTTTKKYWYSFTHPSLIRS